MPIDTAYADFLTLQEMQQLDSLLLKFRMKSEINWRPHFLIHVLLLLMEMETFKPDNTGEMVMDLHIIELAKQKKYSVIGLETEEEEMHFLLPFYMRPLPEQMHEMQLFLARCRSDIQTEDSVIVAALETLCVAYKKHDLNRIEEINIPAKYTELEEYVQNILFKKRNLKWIEKILEAIHEKSSFIAVGCRHLPGEDGLINLLRKMGYTVEPIR
jgi:uncharacterized protein YbaP (TraB family)